MPGGVALHGPCNMKVSDIKAAVRSVCQVYDGIVAAWIFGSAAQGSMKPHSDIDVALLVSENMLHHEHYFDLLGFMSDLEKQTQRQVDAVILNRAGEVLKYEVRKKGQLVYDTDPAVRKSFEITGRKKFEDFMFMHRRYVEKVLYAG